MARLRRGDKLPLKGIEELGNSRKEVRELLSDYEDLDIRIINRESRREIHSGDVLWVVRGVSALDEKRRAIGRSEKKLPRMPLIDARPIWHDHRLELDEALERMPGWTKATAYKHLGKRELPVGRRPRK